LARPERFERPTPWFVASYSWTFFSLSAQYFTMSPVSYSQARLPRLST